MSDKEYYLFNSKETAFIFKKMGDLTDKFYYGEVIVGSSDIMTNYQGYTFEFYKDYCEEIKIEEVVKYKLLGNIDRTKL